MGLTGKAVRMSDKKIRESLRQFNELEAVMFRDLKAYHLGYKEAVENMSKPENLAKFPEVRALIEALKKFGGS